MPAIARKSTSEIASTIRVIRQSRFNCNLVTVHNSAKPANVWSQVALISLGGFFEFYDIFFAGYIAPGLVRSGILPANGIAGFVAAMFSGLFVGTALVSFAADRFGRRTIFTYSLLWYTVASVLMAFQHHAFGLNLWGFISGIGVGVELVTIDTYLSELVPAHLRGRAFAFNQAIQFVCRAGGSAVCVAVGSACSIRIRRLALGGAAGRGWRDLRLVDSPEGSRKCSLDCSTHRRCTPQRQLL